MTRNGQIWSSQCEKGRIISSEPFLKCSNMPQAKSIKANMKITRQNNAPPRKKTWSEPIPDCRKVPHSLRTKNYTQRSGGNNGSMRTVKKQQTKIIWSAIAQRLAGRNDRMRKFLIRSMARSTWLRTDAMRHVFASPWCSNCSLPLRKGGMFGDTSFGRRS